MNNFITLTHIINEEKEPMLVSIQHISNVIPNYTYKNDRTSEINGSQVVLVNGLCYTVTETIDEIADMINDSFVGKML